MTQEMPYESAQDLNRSSDEGGAMVTSGEAEVSTDLAIEDESVEIQFIASEEPLKAGSPERMPWWKRIFAFADRPWAEAVADVVLSEEADPLERAPFPDVAVAAPEEIEPEVSPPPKGAPEALSPQEEAPPEVAAPAAPALSAVEGPPLTLDDVCALLQEELGHTREEVSRIVRAELARGRQDRRSVSLLVSQELAADISEAKLELLAAELDVLNEEEQRALQNPDMPLHERIELVDFVRERRAQVERQIAEVEAALAQRVAETDLALAELEGRDIVASLREELERQKQEITAVKTELATRPKAVTAGLGLPFGGLTAQWATPMLVALLAVAVGVAGVLLPRQTDLAPSFLVEMATLYQATGEEEAAIELLDEAVEAGIDDAETLGQVGQIYYALKEYEGAIEVLSQAVEEAPQDEESRLALARSYGKAQQHQKAIAQYEELIEISPDNWRYHLELGQQYEALQDYDQALEQYQEVTAVAPDRVKGYASQGDLYRNWGRYDEAIEHYQRALEINPNAAWIRLALGESYVGLENWDRAIEQFRAVVELAPDDPSPYLDMGKTWRAQGKYQEALSEYQDALDVRPNHVPTLLEMGDTYLELGDCEQAVLQFLRVLEIQPQNELAQDRLQACEGE